jgi:acetolactate synthase-1/2/3 large subunit
MELTGAQALIRSLEMEGVEVVFGLPGGAILPVYDPLLDSSIRHVLVRHEQGAGHAAEGYAQVTGRPGVAMVTSGPGATNIVTPLMDAMMDSVPLVVVSGQVPTTAIGTDAFQETAITSITMGITKHNWLVTDPADLPRVVAEAFHVATTGRPGPVLVDVPKDVANARTSWYWPAEDDLDLPGYRLPQAPEPGLIRRAAELLLEAERPVLYVGGGVLKAEASAALRRLVALSGAPVVTTLMARGAFPDDDPRCLGMPGMHGTWTATTAMQRADLLVALGSRFDDRVTGNVATFAPGAKVVHVDVDPAEIGKVRRADVGIVADCKVAIEALCAALEELGSTLEGRARPGTLAASRPDLGPWHAQLAQWRQAHPLRYEQAQGGPLKPQFVVETLRELSPPDTVVVTGVGQHQMWASQHWRFAEPRTWVTSGGAGTMGFAVPAALGAKVGRPDRTVWAVDGDGCFQMTAQELVTATAERIPVKVAILNNAYLGMVRQWQELFYEERYSEVYLSPDLPDYVQWAEAMGCRAFRVESPEEVAPTIEKANEIDDRPVVIDFRTDAFEKVYPMVPAGASNDEIIEGPAQGEGGR